jgi:hypothetical protein
MRMRPHIRRVESRGTYWTIIIHLRFDNNLTDTFTDTLNYSKKLTNHNPLYLLAPAEGFEPPT